jgi:hypothetical protein
MKACTNCQARFADDSLGFCLNCGQPLADQNSKSQTKTWLIAAAILGFFLLLGVVVGGIGIYLFNQQNKNSAATPSVVNRALADDARNAEIKTPTANKNPVELLSNVNAPLSSQKNADNAAPRVVVSASSVRKPDGGNFYFPNLAFDKNSATAWCEGANGAGIGEWLKFDFDREIVLTEIKIMPGYFKTRETWMKNNRVANAAFAFSDGTTQNYSFTDEMKTQVVNAGRVKTKWVKITIEDVYTGAADADDTLISEVSFSIEPK